MENETSEFLFEEACGTCWGNGRFIKKKEFITYSPCNGTGNILTSLGRALEDFLQRRGWERK